MGTVGRVESLWRYPDKSMKGEELPEAFIGFGGVYGDRLYAFMSPERPPGYPYLTARECHRMLLQDRKSTRLNSSHSRASRMPSSA